MDPGYSPIRTDAPNIPIPTPSAPSSKTKVRELQPKPRKDKTKTVPLTTLPCPILTDFNAPQALTNIIEKFTTTPDALRMCLAHPALTLLDLQTAFRYAFDLLQAANVEKRRLCKLRNRSDEVGEADGPSSRRSSEPPSLEELFSLSAKDCRLGIMDFVEARVQVFEEIEGLLAAKRVEVMEKRKKAEGKKFAELVEDAVFTVIMLALLAVLYAFLRGT